MDAKDLRQDPEEALRGKSAKLREEIFNLHFKATTEPIDNPAKIRVMRRDIARIEMILHEKKRAGSPSAKRLSRAERKAAAGRKANADAIRTSNAAVRAANEKSLAKKKAAKSKGPKPAPASAAKKQA